MKKITNSWVMVLICAMLAIIACEENIEDDVNPNPGNNDKDPSGNNPPPDGNLLDANEITGSIQFLNSNLISGNMPSSTGTADFKLDTDTIFWVEGIKKRIRVRYPEIFSGSLTSILVQVKNADSYFEIEPDEIESTDTVAVFYFDFDPGNFDVPISFDLEIALKDETGQVVDETEDRPVVIEEPGNFDCSPVGERWDWLYTTIDGVLNRAEGYPQITPGTVKGCCDSGVPYYGNCIGTPLEGTVDYEAFHMQAFEYVKFFAEGNLGGELHENIRNVDPIVSDFCSNSAGYKDRIIHNIFSGQYSFDQASGKITLSDMVGQFEQVTIGSTVYEVPLPLYFGNFLNVEMISCHFMVDRSDVEGSFMERVFERRSEAFQWYD
ncbi:MAG: hypothetical protein KFF73_18290 [Cyclobacteriaceae bacterium]|nr:hypothetical protein [Cyclobacteriaceae bacterium]